MKAQKTGRIQDGERASTHSLCGNTRITAPKPKRKQKAKKES